MVLGIQSIAHLRSKLLHSLLILIFSYKLWCCKMSHIILIVSLFFIQHLQILILFHFLIDSFTGLPETLMQTLDCHRLQQKILYSHLNGFLRILKLVITGNDNKAGLKCLFLYIWNYIKACHLWHTDVDQNNFRMILFNQLDTKLSVSGVTYHSKFILKAPDIFY